MGGGAGSESSKGREDGGGARGCKLGPRPRLRAKEHAGAPPSQRGATYSHRTAPAALEDGAAGFRTPRTHSSPLVLAHGAGTKPGGSPAASAPSLGTGRNGYTEQLSGRLDVPSQRSPRGKALRATHGPASSQMVGSPGQGLAALSLPGKPPPTRPGHTLFLTSAESP